MRYYCKFYGSDMGVGIGSVYVTLNRKVIQLADASRAFVLEDSVPKRRASKMEIRKLTAIYFLYKTENGELIFTSYYQGIPYFFGFNLT